MKMLKPINSSYLGFLLLFVMCKYRTESIYIISKEDSLNKIANTRNGVILMPPAVKYSRFNFFIDSKGDTYFYSFPEPIKANGVFDDVESDSLYIGRNTLTKIQKENEEEFFRKNVLKLKTSEKIKTITIASVNDTIRGSFIKYLIGLKNDSSAHISLNIRRTLRGESDSLK